MAQKDAERFIRDIVKDSALRKILYKYETSAEIMEAIKEQGYEFQLYQFEEGINHLKTESPTAEQVAMLGELLNLWNLLMNDGSIVEEPQACSPSKCFSCASCG